MMKLSIAFPICSNFFNLLSTFLQENLMNAFVHKNLVPKFRHLLSEGVVNCLKNIEIIERKGSYRPLSTKYRICFLTFAFIKRLEGDMIKKNILINGFESILNNTICHGIRLIGAVKIFGL